jgi:dipeptidyl-peptidase-4
MIKTIALLLLPLVFVAQQKITLEDIWSKYNFYPKTPHGFNMMKDGESYVEQGADEKDGTVGLARYDLKSGKKLAMLVRSDEVKFGEEALDLNSAEFSPKEDKLLLNRHLEHIYRRSPAAFYFVYDIPSKRTVQLHPTEKQMFPTFSPDGNKVMYVRGNNIYYHDFLAGQEKQVTQDGEFNKIKNGWADWVYEEEFSKADYFEWSPDSRYIAFCRFDETRVKEYELDYYEGELYPRKYTFKYPKAGEDNSLISVHIFDTQSGKTVKADIGSETDIYIPRIKFTNDPSVLCIQRLNRLQNKLEFLFCDTRSGKTNVVLTDESKTYVDITDDLVFVGKTGFIISSETDGYNHIYYYDLNGKLINQVTKGNWDVMEFKGYDEKTGYVYYISTERGAINRDVYRVKLDGKMKKRLSDDEGNNSFDFTNGFRYYISVWSDANTPPRHELRTIDGKLVKMLEDNGALKAKMRSYPMSTKKFRIFEGADGTDLNGYVIYPQKFDSTKKYPVYMYAYGGPGSNLVNNSFSTFDYFWHQLLAQEGYMVVCVDGRGTMGRGRDFKHSTYMQLGKFETEDQIAVAKSLGALKYVDKDRIGFMGWSYGGYMASLMITKGADVIKGAVAVAPVTNWKYYDNIYTERFMRRPSENRAGYEDNSPVNHVKKIKGKFLLIHGSADDNVHMQNSMEMANAMISQNIPFDFMLYPNKNHSISGGLTRLHIYSKILEFVKENI